MTLKRLLSRWRSDPEIGGNAVDWRTLPARKAELRPLPDDLQEDIRSGAIKRGYSQLYLHQRQSWDLVQTGKNVSITTGTASGKTLCYNLPVLDALARDPQAKALYLFPTKALAQDQKNELGRWQEVLPDSIGLTFGTYDGDTPKHIRPQVRSAARIIISNPDMLHTGIMPNHTKWDHFFRDLKYVVLDEIHIYRGVFGSHVANVVRRLKRICAFYGSHPRFILTSATISNPVQLAEKMIEEPVSLVSEDGSPRGPKHFLFYNPPVVDQKLGIRKSAMQEAVRLADDLLAYDLQTILFARTRKAVEIILGYLRDQFPGQSEMVRGYRSGYLPAVRREIETGLREGAVKAVVATNALELGIDIGGLEAAVITGFPGTIASLWQQAGRAGRATADSLAVLVTSAAPIDQYLARNPQYFFGRSPERALINPDNLLVLLGHLRCAAFELPFKMGQSFGNLPWEMVEQFLLVLAENTELYSSGEEYHWMSQEYPAESMSLRTAAPSNVVLEAKTADGWRTIGQVDQESAYWMVHPQAIYIHEGSLYWVQDLDLEQGTAQLLPTDADYFTNPIADTEVSLVELQDKQSENGAEKAFGELQIDYTVVGYKKTAWYSHEQLGVEEIDMPTRTLQSNGYWLALEEDLLEHLREEGFWGSDPNKYGKDWPRLTEAVRTRDNFECQVCGKPETDRKHDVHHIRPFRSFLNPADANQMDNLTTLCNACHRQAESVVKIRSGLSGLGYVIWNLAPLFLMCDIGDLGLYVEPSSGLADGRPVVAIYEFVPAGVGFSQSLFEIHGKLLNEAVKLIKSCPCEDGCPACTGPGGEQGSGGKAETLAILEYLTGKKKLPRT